LLDANSTSGFWPLRNMAAIADAVGEQAA